MKYLMAQALSEPMLSHGYNDLVASSTAVAIPNLLDQFDMFKPLLLDKKILIFLDYDGTLTPIVAKPSDAVLSEDVRSLLTCLSLSYTVSIVTGRAMKQIKEFVRIIPDAQMKFFYAASHGFRIEGGRTSFSHFVGQQHLPSLREFSTLMQHRLQSIAGVAVEDNEYAISIHYRNALDDDVKDIECCIDEALENFPTLKKTYGKKVFEIRLCMDWDKGRAVAWMLEAMGYSMQDENILLIYIGDDITDEDAFRTLKRCPHFLSVLVASEYRPTEAVFQLQNTDQVHQFLQKLMTLRQPLP